MININMLEHSSNTNKMVNFKSGKKTGGGFDSEPLERTQEYWENRPEVHQMRYANFVEEYEECMNIAEKKEKNGNLDFHSPNYIPMTEEEVSLHEKDWRAFSRQRGFSEYDIAEYARWHKLSGQTDGLECAINDPWRRHVSDWDKQLYVKHIEKALSSEMSLAPEVMEDYETIKKELENPQRLWHGRDTEDQVSNPQTFDVQPTISISDSDWNDDEW